MFTLKLTAKRLICVDLLLKTIDLERLIFAVQRPPLMNSTRLILSHISAVELQLQRHPASKNQSRSYRSRDSNATAKLIKTQLGPLQSKASFSDSVLPDSAGFEGGIHHTTICTHTMHMTFNGLTVHRLLLFRGEGRRGTLGSSPAAAASVPVVQEDVELKRFVRTIHTIHERTSTTNLLCQVSRHQQRKEGHCDVTGRRSGNRA